MTDTVRTLSALQTLFADNSEGDITAQNLRDFLVSSNLSSGQNLISTNGATSTSALLMTGTLFTGGTGTTNVPHILLQTSNPTVVTTWSTSATYIGINADNNFTGNFLDFHVNGGSSLFSVAANGTLSVSGNIAANANIAISNAGYNLVWANGSWGIIGSTGVGVIKFGGYYDIASPVAQTLSVQSVVAGTSNTAGANFTINGSKGTGTGIGGSIIFQTSSSGTTGSSQNVLNTVLTLDGNLTATFAGQLSVGSAITMGSSNTFNWAGRGTLSSPAAGQIQLGRPDAAAPVAQTLSVQNVVAGTSNTAGTNFTIVGSIGTGTGIGGSIIFQVAPAGSSSSAQNSLSTAVTIASDKSVTFAGTVIYSATATPSSASATGVTGTITWDSSFIYVCVASSTWKRAALSTW